MAACRDRVRHGIRKERMRHAHGTRKEEKRRLLLYALLALILAFDLTYAFAFASGPTNLSEDNAYAVLAISALHGQFNFNNLDSGRILEYLPIAGFFYLFGLGVYSSTAWNVAMFVGSVFIAFLLGKELYNEKCGLLSALLLSFFTPTVSGAIRIEINEAMMFFTALALLFLLYGYNRKSRKWMLASGALLAVSPLTTPIALYAAAAAVLFMLVEVARRRMTRSLLAYLFAGMAVASFAILALSSAVSGNPLTIITLNQAYYANLTMTSTTYGIIGAPVAYANYSLNDLSYYLYYYPENMFAYSNVQSALGMLESGRFSLGALANQLINRSTTAGFYFYAVVAGIAYLIFRREKRLYFPAVWLTVGFAFIQFAPQGLTLAPFRWILIFRDVRYFASIAIPTSVIIAMALARITDGWEERWRVARRGAWQRRTFELAKPVFAAAVAVFLIATSIPVNLSWSSYINAEYYSLHAIASMFVNANTNTTIYYPSGDYSQFPIYLGNNKHLNAIMLDGIPNCSDFENGSYVIIPNATIGYAPKWQYINDTGKYCPNLELVAAPYDSAASDGLIHVAEEYEQKLYYVTGT